MKVGKHVASNVARNIADKTKTAISATKGIATTALRTLGKADIIGGAVVVGIEIARTAYDIHSKYKNMNNGNISKGEFFRCTVKRVFQAGGTVAGGIIGGIVGSFMIPVPILGTMIGATVGSVLGGFFGKMCGCIAGRNIKS